MIPVDQDEFYDPNRSIGEQRGNCWSATLASMLELPLAEVPNFVQIDVDGGENWWMHTQHWLAERGYRLQMLWFGIEPVHMHYIACGRSPRAEGLYHSVVYLDGELAHDPHPSRAGILDITNLYRLEPL